MNIMFERTGGFAGMRITLSLDSNSLPPADTDALQKLISEADFFNLTETQSDRSQYDGFQYTIRVQVEGQVHTLHLTDDSVPEKLQPFLNELSGRARSQRRAP